MRDHVKASSSGEIRHYTPEDVLEAAASIRDAVGDVRPSVGIITGSGLGDILDPIEHARFIDYADVPHMVCSTAPTHKGRLVIGNIGDTQVICMQGRLHSYEGHSAQDIAFPIFVMRELGVNELIVTNAAGGVNESYEVGDLMLIEDHINMLGINPCIGPDNPELYPRFFDMTYAYAPELRERVQKAAAERGIELQSGVYIATKGPSFETPAEIRAFRTLGADAVGMSTVPEVIAARGCGMEVLGISMISNPAAGVLDEPLDVDDVAVAAQRAASKIADLIVGFTLQGR